MCADAQHAQLQSIAPLDDIVLEWSSTSFLALVSQKYRIPTIWHGDLETAEESQCCLRS